MTATLALTENLVKGTDGLTDRRTALLVAAIEEIARRGTRGLRVEDVAKSAGVSPALIYHHFGDRSTLLQAALEHIGARADAYTGHHDGSGRQSLLTVLLSEIQNDDAVRTNSAAWGELRDSAIFDHALRPTITNLTDRWITDLADLVATAHQDGSITPARDPRQLGLQLSAMVEGISSRWLTGQLNTEAARAHIAEITETLLGPVPARRRRT
jgi:AcrR family transcriptional regulator